MQNKEVALAAAKEVFRQNGIELNAQCLRTLELVFNAGYWSGYSAGAQSVEGALTPVKNLLDTII